MTLSPHGTRRGVLSASAEAEVGRSGHDQVHQCRLAVHAGLGVHLLELHSNGVDLNAQAAGGFQDRPTHTNERGYGSLGGSQAV